MPLLYKERSADSLMPVVVARSRKQLGRRSVPRERRTGRDRPQATNNDRLPIRSEPGIAVAERAKSMPTTGCAAVAKRQGVGRGSEAVARSEKWGRAPRPRKMAA